MRRHRMTDYRVARKTENERGAKERGRGARKKERETEEERVGKEVEEELDRGDAKVFPQAPQAARVRLRWSEVTRIAARARARAKAAVSSFLFALSERAGFPVGRANFVI